MADLVAARMPPKSLAAAEAALDAEDADDGQEVPLGPGDTTAPEAGEEDAELTLEQYIQEEAPYSAERTDKLRKFFRKRNKRPDQYTYLTDGNLAILGKEGDVKETLPLKTYVPYDASTWATRDQRRLDAIAMAETAYEDARAGLRAAMEMYQATGAVKPVLDAQAACAAADAVMARVRYGSRGMTMEANPETRDVVFSQGREARKLVSPEEAEGWSEVLKNAKGLARMVTREYPYYTFYGSYVEAPSVPSLDADAALDEVPDESEASVRQRLRDGRMARVIFDPDDGPNGFLSPFFPVEFTMGSTNYFTAYQAYEAERAKEAGNEPLRTKILGSRSARTIRNLVKAFKTEPKDAKGLWMRIFTALFTQHGVLKERLLGTGTDALVFADALGGNAGIGLAPGDSGVVDPAKWKGGNLVGLVLETLRIQYREGTAKEAPGGDATEGVITEEEQAAARTGAIIAQQKKKFSFTKKPGTA